MELDRTKYNSLEVNNRRNVVISIKVPEVKGRDLIDSDLTYKIINRAVAVTEYLDRDKLIVVDEEGNSFSIEMWDSWDHYDDLELSIVAKDYMNCGSTVITLN